MKTYLGDAVYADFDQFGDLILTTEDGIRATNRIVLEPTVLAELKRFLGGMLMTSEPDDDAACGYCTDCGAVVEPKRDGAGNLSPRICDDCACACDCDMRSWYGDKHDSETRIVTSADTIGSIAYECASFAHDNFDPKDSDGFNSGLTPEAIWEGWHSKEDIEPIPEMPAGFIAMYLYECERAGGADFADDIRKLAAGSR